LLAALVLCVGSVSAVCNPSAAMSQMTTCVSTAGSCTTGTDMTKVCACLSTAVSCFDGTAIQACASDPALGGTITTAVNGLKQQSQSVCSGGGAVPVLPPGCNDFEMAAMQNCSSPFQTCAQKAGVVISDSAEPTPAEIFKACSCFPPLVSCLKANACSAREDVKQGIDQLQVEYTQAGCPAPAPAPAPAKAPSSSTKAPTKAPTEAPLSSAASLKVGLVGFAAALSSLFFVF